MSDELPDFVNPKLSFLGWLAARNKRSAVQWMGAMLVYHVGLGSILYLAFRHQALNEFGWDSTGAMVYGFVAAGVALESGVAFFWYAVAAHKKLHAAAFGALLVGSYALLLITAGKNVCFDRQSGKALCYYRDLPDGQRVITHTPGIDPISSDSFRVYTNDLALADEKKRLIAQGILGSSAPASPLAPIAAPPTVGQGPPVSFDEPDTTGYSGRVVRNQLGVYSRGCFRRIAIRPDRVTCTMTIVNFGFDTKIDLYGLDGQTALLTDAGDSLRPSDGSVGNHRGSLADRSDTLTHDMFSLHRANFTLSFDSVRTDQNRATLRFLLHRRGPPDEEIAGRFLRACIETIYPTPPGARGGRGHAGTSFARCDAPETVAAPSPTEWRNPDAFLVPSRDLVAASQSQDGTAVQLQQCQAHGTTVRCYLVVTNSAADEKYYFYSAQRFVQLEKVAALWDDRGDAHYPEWLHVGSHDVGEGEAD